MLVKTRQVPSSSWWVFGALLFLVFAIVMASFGFPEIVQNEMKKKLSLANDTPVFGLFKEMPFPIAFKVYLFNVTNPEEVTQGEKPILQEVGPYVYDEYRSKEILSIDPEKDTITYNQFRKMYFNEEKSNGLSEEDIITHINLPYMALLTKVSEMMPSMVPLAAEALNLLFDGVEDPFQRNRVKDLLFDGVFLNCTARSPALSKGVGVKFYKSLYRVYMSQHPLSSLGSGAFGRGASLKLLSTLICGQIKAQKLDLIRPTEDGAGFLYSMFNHMNTSGTGPIEVQRGSRNLAEVGKIVGYKGKNSTSAWGDSYCSALNGTDGTIQPPLGPQYPEKVYTFQPDICRSLFTELENSQKETFNITTVRYESTWKTLASKSADPSNNCFCKRNWSQAHDGCLLNGVFSLEPCLSVPVIASMPHFYTASEELLTYFDGGIQPNRDKHASFLEIEPSTGVVLRGSSKAQFNIELRLMEKVEPLKSVPTGLFPLLWIDMGAEVPEDLLGTVLNAKEAMKHVEVARWVILGLAIAGVLVACAWVVASFRRTRLNSINFSPTQFVSK